MLAVLMLVGGWTSVSVSGLFLRVHEIFGIEKDRLRKTLGNMCKRLLMLIISYYLITYMYL